MELNNLYKKFKKEQQKYMIKKYSVKENAMFLMGLNIHELYNIDANILQLKLVVHIQEEGHGSLFTQPAIYLKYKKGKEYWIKKDFYGFDRFYIEEDLDKILKNNIEENYYNLKLPDDSQKHCMYLADILDNYEWDHFVNIGAFERAEQQSNKTWHSIPIADTKEKIWVGDFSQKNWLEALSVIYPHTKEEFKEKMLTLVRQHDKENLEETLEENLLNGKIIKRVKI